MGHSTSEVEVGTASLRYPTGLHVKNACVVESFSAGRTKHIFGIILMNKANLMTNSRWQMYTNGGVIRRVE